MTKKELLIILILAVLVTGVSWPLTANLWFLEGYGDGWGWPINYVGVFTWLTGEREDITRINWQIFIIDLLFWFLVLAGSWLVLKFVLKKIEMKK